MRVPELPEWTEESRIQGNSPDSQAVPKRGKISPGFWYFSNFGPNLAPFFSNFQYKFKENIFNIRKFFILKFNWIFEKINLCFENLKQYLMKNKNNGEACFHILNIPECSKISRFWPILMKCSVWSSLWFWISGLELKYKKYRQT